MTRCARHRTASTTTLLLALGFALGLGHLAGCTEDESTPLDEVPALISLPAQFTDSAVADVGSPTALAFTPDGRLLIATQGGKLRVYRDGALRGTAALDLGGQICTNSERGLLGVAVDPNYATNKFVYLFFTKNKHNSCAGNRPGTSPVNRVSRFTYKPSTDTIDASSELVLIDNMLSLGGNHNGGDLHFGRDGFLYVTVGDSGCQLRDSSRCGGTNQNAKWASLLSGKILRIATDGSIPSSNPNVGNSNAARCGAPGPEPEYPMNNTRPCLETFAGGLRNPFRFAFKPDSDEFFINDVGQNKWEEIDEGKKGADYGWPSREAHCANDSTTNCGAPPSGLTNPIHSYGRGANCKSITGGAFVPAGAFGNSFDGAYLFGDYACGKVFKLTRSGGSSTVTDFATALGGSSVVAMRFGPSPSGSGVGLYYTTYADGGKVRRIDFTGTVNRPPVARIAANRISGSVPLTVTFDGAGSADPDGGDTLSYQWTFGDGATQTTSTPTVSHVYNTSSNVTAQLVVKDNRGALSPPATIALFPGNTAPTISISSPAAGDLFAVDQVVTLRATASDAQDGTLPASGLTWTVIRHHDDHTHPWFGPRTGSPVSFAAPAPEDLLAASNSFLEILVSVTDSRGQTTTVRRDFFPREVALSFRTSPAGLRLKLAEVDAVAPTTITSWDSYELRVEAAATQTDSAGRRWTFSSWSDGGAATHVIDSPATATTYTATYVAATGFAAKINFQPAGATIPTGYVADTGAAFADRGGGLRFGWNAANNETRDRDNAASPDQRYDTLNHLQKPSNPNASWEIEVPNGTYDVHVAMGDAANIDSVFRLNAEGTLIASGTPTASRKWIEADAVVTVNDGRLTLSNGSGAANNKICFVDITRR